MVLLDIVILIMDRLRGCGYSYYSPSPSPQSDACSHVLTRPYIGRTARGA